MLGSLIKLATHLDNNGYHKEADYLDAVLKKHADNGSYVSTGSEGSYAEAAEGLNHEKVCGPGVPVTFTSDEGLRNEFGEDAAYYLEVLKELSPNRDPNGTGFRCGDARRQLINMVRLKKEIKANTEELNAMDLNDNTRERFNELSATLSSQKQRYKTLADL